MKNNELTENAFLESIKKLSRILVAPEKLTSELSGYRVQSSSAKVANNKLDYFHSLRRKLL